MPLLSAGVRVPPHQSHNRSARKTRIAVIAFSTLVLGILTALLLRSGRRRFVSAPASQGLQPSDFGMQGTTRSSATGMSSSSTGEHVYSFRLPADPGSKTYADMDWCPGSMEPPVEEVPAVDPRLRALFVIGAQKAGTTWLYHAFSQHPGIVMGQTRAMHKRGKSKELQFFTVWPAERTDTFMEMWPPEEIEKMKSGDSENFLFDASPEYLLSPVVPPRMKQIIPQAKIVIILRDPTDRAFSGWSMNADRKYLCDVPGKQVARLCVQRTFQDTFDAYRANFSRPECEFQTPGADVSWGDCFRCNYTRFQNNVCMDRREKDLEFANGPFECKSRAFDVFDYSTYAPQIAWWLEFFSPEQIYVSTSGALHDKQKRVTVLNEILDFVGLPNATRFTQSMADKATSFNGKYKSTSTSDPQALKTVAAYHEHHNRDLHALLTQYFPYVDLSGLEPK